MHPLSRPHLREKVIPCPLSHTDKSFTTLRQQNLKTRSRLHYLSQYPPSRKLSISIPTPSDLKGTLFPDGSPDKRIKFVILFHAVNTPMSLRIFDHAHGFHIISTVSWLPRSQYINRLPTSQCPKWITLRCVAAYILQLVDHVDTSCMSDTYSRWSWSRQLINYHFSKRWIFSTSMTWSSFRITRTSITPNVALSKQFGKCQGSWTVTRLDFDIMTILNHG